MSLNKRYIDIDPLYFGVNNNEYTYKNSRLHVDDPIGPVSEELAQKTVKEAKTDFEKLYMKVRDNEEIRENVYAIWNEILPDLGEFPQFVSVFKPYSRSRRVLSIREHFTNSARDVYYSIANLFKSNDSTRKELTRMRHYSVGVRNVLFSIVKLFNLRNMSRKESTLTKHFSDGAREVFYAIGNVLLAEKNSTIIVDEPELHLHRSILNKLWIKLRKERSDCCFIFITHEIDFALNLPGDTLILNRSTVVGKWEIENLSDKKEGYDEDIKRIILGGREPVLFVEGKFDLRIFRILYPDWRVYNRGGWKNVKEAVKLFADSRNLHRIQCVGIIDRDELEEDEIKKITNDHQIEFIEALEIENLFYSEQIINCLVNLRSEEVTDFSTNASDIESEMFKFAENELNATVSKIGRAKLKLVYENHMLCKDISNEKNLEKFREHINNFKIEPFEEKIKLEINQAIKMRNLDELGKLYRNKKLFGVLSKCLKFNSRSEFEIWIAKALEHQRIPKLNELIKEKLPDIDKYLEE